MLLLSYMQSMVLSKEDVPNVVIEMGQYEIQPWFTQHVVA
jgi:hypothetical protein